MKKFHPISIIILLSTATLCFSGCGKSTVNCFENSGRIIIEQRELISFDSIELHDNINLILTDDPNGFARVEAGENIIEGITTEVVNRQLIIRNTNSCNWVRSYAKPLNVYLHARDYHRIDYHSSGDISCTDTIRRDSMIVVAWEGCGSIDLTIQTYKSYFSEIAGTTDFNIDGRTAINYIYSADYGPIDCRHLASGYCYITNKSSNNCYVNASKELEAMIGSIGNIYYTGNPPIVTSTITGEGRLIPF